MKRNRIWVSAIIRWHQLKNGLKNRFHFVKMSKISSLLSDLPDYPSIAASPSQFLELYLSGAKSSLEELAAFNGMPALAIIDVREYVDKETQNDPKTLSLKEGFEQQGSDKGGTHEYYLLYAFILKSFQQESTIMEVGLGTNNVSTPSNMGIFGRPGASLRTWIMQPKISKVVGADIDPGALFEEEGIKTYELDQTSHTSWNVLKKDLGNQTFDLIVDDGLHSPHANFVTISESLDLLSNTGKIVIEDIHERHLPIWRIFIGNLPAHLQATMIKCRKAYVLLLEQK